MSSITDFGNSTAEQQLDILENYCDDLIHYYNPQLHLEIDQAVLSELMKDVSFLAEMEQNMVLAKELFRKMKEGDCRGISEETMETIKNIVFNNLVKYNLNDQFYNFVMERMYGSSQWILDERGKVLEAGGAIWYRPRNKDEYLYVLKKNSLFSCVSIVDGENLESFSLGYVAQESADNYNLLIFSN